MFLVLALAFLTAYIGYGMNVTRNQYAKRTGLLTESKIESIVALQGMKHASYCYLNYGILAKQGCNCINQDDWRKVTGIIDAYKVPYILILSWPFFYLDQFLRGKSTPIHVESERVDGPQTRLEIPVRPAINDGGVGDLWRENWRAIEKLYEEDVQNAKIRGYEYLDDGSVKMLDSSKRVQPQKPDAWRKPMSDFNKTAESLKKNLEKKVHNELTFRKPLYNNEKGSRWCEACNSFIKFNEWMEEISHANGTIRILHTDCRLNQKMMKHLPFTKE